MRTRSDRVHTAVLVLMGFGWPVVAQTGAAPSSVGAAHAALGFLVGRWSYEGEARPGPLGSGGPVSGTETCAWFAGKLFLVCRSEWVTGSEVSQAMGIVGYSPERQRYSFYDIDDTQPEAGEGWGVFADSTWSWVETQSVGGRPAKERYTLKELSTDSFTLREEVAVGTEPWVLVESGKATRVP